MLRPPPLGFESVGAPFQQATNQSEYDQENDSNLLMSWSNLLSLPNQDWIIFYSLFAHPKFTKWVSPNDRWFRNINPKKESELPLFHLSLEDEQLSKLDISSSENKSNESNTTRRPSIDKETVIQLPRGTIIKIGEEKQEPSKPGRKRKGFLLFFIENHNILY